MALGDIVLPGATALLGAFALLAGGTKVGGTETQVEAFEHYGYPQWFRVVTGGLEIAAGVALLAALVTVPILALAGSLLLVGVMSGAVVTHVRIDDPVSTTAIPAMLLVVSVAVAVAYGSPFLP